MHWTCGLGEHTRDGRLEESERTRHFALHKYRACVLESFPPTVERSAGTMTCEFRVRASRASCGYLEPDQERRREEFFHGREMRLFQNLAASKSVALVPHRLANLTFVWHDVVCQLAVRTI